MTAIGGVISFSAEPRQLCRLNTMGALIDCYGNQDLRFLEKDNVCLVVSQLLVYEEDRRDDQPLHCKESNFSFVFDGRIDNRQDIAARVGHRGPDLENLPDSMLAFLAFKQYRGRVLDYLVGDFAFAATMPRERRISIARSNFGLRPLFWARMGGDVVFCTWPKGIVAYTRLEPKLSKERIADFLVGINDRGEGSFFTDIHKVPAGSLLTLDHDYCKRINSKGLTAIADRPLFGRSSELEDSFLDALRSAVSRRMRVGTRVASHLSAGMDSSAVTAVAANVLASQQRELLALTAVPALGDLKEKSNNFLLNEGPKAALMTKLHSNIAHVQIAPTGISLIDILEEETEVLDHPVHSAFHLRWVKSLKLRASDFGVNVMLSSDIGNITISYEGAWFLPALLARFRWIRLLAELRACQSAYPNQSIIKNVRKTFGFHLRGISSWMPPRVPSFEVLSPISPGLIAAAGVEDRWRDSFNYDREYCAFSRGVKGQLRWLNGIDAGEFYAADDVYGHVRYDPTADIDLVNLCLSLPLESFWHSGRSKQVLRSAMKGLVHPTILHSSRIGVQASDRWSAFGLEVKPICERFNSLKHLDASGELLNIKVLRRISDDLYRRWEHVHPKERRKFLMGLSMLEFLEYTSQRMGRSSHRVA